MTRPRATHEGKLFEGLLDCYVLEDERRVVSRNGMARAIAGVTGSVNLDRYVERIPGGTALLASCPVIEFNRPNGGVAHGLEATAITKILRLYVDALGKGTLHPQQMQLAGRAAMMLAALADLGVVALIDEATGYQAVREATALSFTYRALLLQRKTDWDLMWDPQITEALCRLHGEQFDGVQPRFLGSTYDKLYRLVLGEEVVDELKRRNPAPTHGTNHHQWLTPEAREVVRHQIGILTVLADQCGTKEEFWARVEHLYAKKPLQLTWLAPARVRKDESDAAE